MNTIKTYFPAPTWESPPNGPIRLGNVILDPKAPEDAIEGTPLALPASVTIYISKQLDWKVEKSKEREGKIGIWAKFLQVIGIGGEVGSTGSNNVDESYEFEELETQWFQPPRQYVEQCTQLPAVQEYLVKRYNLYIVTGIKIARGATMANNQIKKRGFNASITVDLTALGGTLTEIGPGGSLNRTDQTKITFHNDSDFVFAYRLSEIEYRKKSRSIKPYVDGALYSIDDDGQQKEIIQKKETTDDFEVIGVASADYNGDGEEEEILTRDEDEELRALQV